MPADASSRRVTTDEPAFGRLTRVLQEAVSRRMAGEAVSDEQIIHDHRDLMPELGEHLSQLRAVEAARRRAEHSSENQALTLRVERGTQSAAKVSGASADLAAATDALPGYEVLHELHRGGQGVVYLAIQKSTRRQVAIKVMREGPFAGGRERARFEQEVHILAQLNHPNIVAIHDSGVAAGHHYFVMDYVDGKRLDHWAADFATAGRPTAHPPALNTILELFADICDAVNAAHLRGIIHRDLKPGNILVVQEEASLPKILDFGLAKRTANAVADASGTVEQTIAGQFVGSLPWASPEQVTGAIDRLDIRTDVYSLGVIGFGLVTGGLFPYEVHGNLPDVVRTILHADPRRARAINHSVSIDIETILQTCLEKDPARRYQSAGEVAREVRRYLSGEPIEARRGSGWYVLTKSLYRHRVAATIAGLFAILITGSSVALLFMYREQSRLRGEAQQQADLAVRQSGLAQAESQKAQREASKALHTTEFLRDMLAAVDPNKAKGSEPTVREVLESAAAQVDAKFAEEPSVAAAIHRTIGQTYIALGKFPEAEAQYQSALANSRREFAGVHGDDHPDTLDALNGLATTFELQTRNDEAEALYRQCLEGSRRVRGEEDPATIDVLHNLANFLRNVGRAGEAEPLLREALELSARVQGPEHSGTLLSKKILAALWMDQGRYDLAEPAFREVLEAQRRTLGDKSPFTLGTIQYLAMLLKAMGRLDEADPLYVEAMATATEVLGEDHHDTLRTANSFGRLRVDQGKLEEAEALFRKAKDAQRRTLGEEHFDTLVTTNNLALLLQDQGRLDEAEPLARYVEATGRRILGEKHPSVLTWMNNLGNLLTRQGKLEDGEALYRRTLDGRREVLGENHPGTLHTRMNHALCLSDLGRHDEALPAARQTLELRQQVSGEKHPDTLLAMSNLARMLLSASTHEASGNGPEIGGAGIEGLGESPLDEAEELARQAFALRREVLGDNHPDTLLSANNLGGILIARSQPGTRGTRSFTSPDESDPANREEQSSTSGGVRSSTSWGVRSSASPELPDPLLIEAEELLRSALASAEENLPPTHWYIPLLQTTYGRCLTRLHRYQEAESHLSAGCEGLSNLLGPEHPRTRECSEALLEAQKTPDEH